MSEIPSREFDDIVSGLDIGTVMHMDGTYVLADKELGQEFRYDVRKTFARTLERTGSNPRKPDARVTARLDRAYSGQLNHGQVAIQAGELIAVTGVDYIKVGIERGEDAFLEPRLLDGNSYLFGRVCTVTYDSFPIVKDYKVLAGELDPDKYRVAIQMGEAEGLVLYLGSAMICQADDYTAKPDVYEACVVPLDNHRFTFYKAVAAA